MNAQNQGQLNIWIDEIVPCLIDVETGEIKETYVYRVETRNFLKEFRKSNGWYINWAEIPKDLEVYVLALNDTKEIQGLICFKNDTENKAVYLSWACTAPHNNKHDTGKQKYKGVGGHLFAIAADKSRQWGNGGAMYGFAANKELLDHYCIMFKAIPIGVLHPYHFLIDEAEAIKLLEVYTYEWNDTNS